MIRGMTTVAQGDQIRWFIAAGGTWKNVMNISFISIARLLTFGALEMVTSKYTLTSGVRPTSGHCVAATAEAAVSLILVRRATDFFELTYGLICHPFKLQA
jgi:hypothetical protein